MTAPPAPQLLSKREVQRRLSISPRWVSELIRRGPRGGGLAVVRIGRRTLVAEAELQRFIADHTK